MSQTTPREADEYARLSDLTESERYRLLADVRRRRTLDVLSNATATVELSELAAAVAERAEAHSGERTVVTNRVAISLHHVHLPRMDELGVLDYDSDSNLIRP